MPIRLKKKGTTEWLRNEATGRRVLLGNGSRLSIANAPDTAVGQCM